MPLGKRRRYNLEIESTILGLKTGWGYPDKLKFTVGFLLEKTASSYGANNGGNDFMDFMAMMAGPSEKGAELRNDIIKKGDSVGHLFSCVEYNKNTSMMTFDMCEDIFQKFGDYFFSIILTDSWKVVKENPCLRLSEAKCAH